MERADEDFNFFIEHRANLDRLEGQERLRVAVERSRTKYTVPRMRGEPRAPSPGAAPSSAAAPVDEVATAEAASAEPLPAIECSDQPVIVAKTEAAPDAELDGFGAAADAASEVPVATETVEEIVPPPPTLPGKGGTKHKEWQNRIKLEAEKFGFRAFVEAPIGSGHESVDIVAVRDRHRIAVELSSTTSVDVELKNLRKCLQQDFSLIALLSDDPKHVARMSALAPTILEPGQSVTIRCEAPDAFLAHLAALSCEPESDAARRVRGLKIRRTFSTTSAVDHAQRLEVAIKQLAFEMPRPPTPDVK